MYQKSTEQSSILSIREARADDAELLWRWGNDPSVRKRSFNKESIAWETHINWFSQRINSPETRFYILLENSVPVGQIRYDRDKSKKIAEISFLIDKNQRGKGFGTKILQLTCKRAAQDLECKTIIGVVIEGNEASFKAFLRAGFINDGLCEIKGYRAYRFVQHTDSN